MREHPDRQIVGPDCTADQAEALWKLLWSNPFANRPDNPAATAALFMQRFKTWPYSCVSAAIEQLIDSERFFPAWADIRALTESHWRLLVSMRRGS